jgi:hypothetical protein
MPWITELLDNKSVAAFIGAFSAFLLVFATDWRRERLKVKYIRAEIEINQVIARNKIDTARGNRSLIRGQNKIAAAPTLKFNTGLIRGLTAEVLGRLTADQRRAIEALCYRMDAIDQLFNDVATQSKKYEPPSSLTNEERHHLGKSIISTYADIIVNLKVLVEMSADYLNGHFTEVVTRRHDPAKYEEA